MLQLIGLALLTQGPEYYNPAKGTGCARVNAERMSEGIETDYWCVLSALPHYLFYSLSSPSLTLTQGRRLLL